MESAELEVGGVYSCRTSKATFYVAKILASDELGYYVRSYGNVFRERPTLQDVPVLSMEKTDSRWWPIGCVPILKEGVYRDEPILLEVQDLTAEEMACLAEMLEE
jgi:hypothetical protein